MSFGESPNCPMCDTPVSLRLVWEITPLNRFGLLAQSTGVVCPTCATKLRIVQGRSGLAVALLFVFALASAALAGHLTSTPKSIVTVIGCALLIIAVFSSGKIARRFARLRKREGTDTVDFPIERLKAQQQEVVNVENSNRELLERIETPAWNCPKCLENVPAGFGLCWKCGASYANDT